MRENCRRGWGCVFLILFSLSGCAQTESLAGNHQAARQDFARQGRKLEKRAFQVGARFEHIQSALLYSDAARLHLKAAQEASLLGNTMRVKEENHQAAHDFIKASDESLKSGGLASDH